ncbi:MAG: hypothetical protein ACPF8V_01070 [Luteibaculum sp.]
MNLAFRYAMISYLRKYWVLPGFSIVIWLSGINISQAQKIAVNIQRSDVEFSNRNADPTNLGHYMQTHYPQKHEIIERINRDYREGEEFLALKSLPLWTGFTGNYYPNKFNFKDGSIQSAITVGYGRLNILEAFSSTFYNEDFELEIFRTEMRIFREYLILGNQWDFRFVQYKKMDLGGMIGINYNFNVASNAFLHAQGSTKSGATISLSDEEFTSVKKSFFNTAIGLYTSISLNDFIRLKGSFGMNQLYFGANSFVPNSEIIPHYGFAVILNMVKRGSN